MVCRCIHPDCTKIALYNHHNYHNGLYCVNHKLKDMVDVKHPKCLYGGGLCSKRASFGFKRYKPLYCFNHKLECMRNVTKN